MTPSRGCWRRPPRGGPSRFARRTERSSTPRCSATSTHRPWCSRTAGRRASAIWTYQIRELRERGLRVVAYDLRGHGRSRPAAGGDYSIARFGEDLEAVLATCVPEGRRAMVVGHSLGAMTVAAWAENHEVEARAGAAALINTGRRRPDRRAAAGSGPARSPRRSTAPSPSTASSAAGRRCPDSRARCGHALIRYVAFGPNATPAQVAFYERMLIAWPPDARASIGIALSDGRALPRTAAADGARRS